MTTSADINFGDNDKAVFGAGNDLQIYHDGSDSLIKDVGSGDLNISAGNDLRLQDSSGNNYFKAGEGGASKVYYAGAEKLATTSTGIDVTGTVSSGDITITDTFPVMSLVGTTGGATWNQLVLSDGSYQIRSGTPSRLNISTGGDISFYEDTGTTPKFFWDASAERLGLGTTSPQRPLHLDIGTDNTAARFQSTDTEVALEFIDPAGTAYFRASGDYIKMGATQSDSLTILDGGNVGIGTDSPARTLDVVGDASISTTGNSTGLRITTSTTGEGYFIFGDTDDASMGGMSYSNNTNALMFDANNLERMRIDSSGALLLHPNNATRGLKITTTQTTAVGDTTTYDTLGAGHGRHVFKTDGTEAMRIDSSGHLIVPNGITLGTAVGTYAAANTLDDYEEGTFTATLTPETSGTITMNSSFDKLAYTKIGRVVTITGRIKVSAVSSPVGQFVRLSLPFAIGNDDEESERPTGTVTLQNAAQDIDKYCIHPTSGTISYIQIGRTDNFASNAAPDFSGNELLSIALTYIT
jgi:hypothetical protein